MSTSPESTREQIEQVRAQLEAAKTARSESRIRRESAAASDGSSRGEPIPEGEEEIDGGRGIGAPGTEVRDPTEAVGSATQKAKRKVSAYQEAQEKAQTPRAQATYYSAASRRPDPPNPNPESQAQAIPGPSVQRNVGNNLSELTAAQIALMEELQDINGQDSYDALAAGIGKLKRSEYLLLPTGFSIPNIRPEDVGKPIAHANLTIRDWANLYALNKSRAPEGADAKIFALLRMEAVKCGWLESQREVAFDRPPADSIVTLATDLTELRDRAATIKTASFLVPLVAEHVFRTYGHHFISSDSANYVSRYQDTLRSCLASEVSGILPPATLYHSALHWVSPGRARRVLMAQLESSQIPDALKIRAYAAPAGTAILTTTAAILTSMSAVGIDELFRVHGGFDVAGIHQVTAMIKADPCRYHKSYFAYNISAPEPQQMANVDRMKNEAIKFAPFAQAYINSFMRDAALGKAQALKKHADQNPIQMRRAGNLFRALARGDVRTVEDLFRTNLASNSVDDF